MVESVEVSIEEDGWQKVATKQARRAAHKAAREEREQRRPLEIFTDPKRML